MELMLNLLKWSVIVGAAALLLTLLKPLLDRRYSARWRWGAWLVMAALLLLAPVRWESLAPRIAAAPPVVIEVPKVEVSVSRQEGISFQRPAGTVLPEGSAARPGAPRPQVRNRTFPLEELMLTLWLTGAALFLLYHGLGTWYFARRARRWSRSAGEETLRIYGETAREMGVKRPPALRVSPAVDSPMMVGLLRPRLLLPGEDFGERELRFILRHELTHHRRHDLWYKLALLLANGMHWFNPLAALLRREAERDLELTCDDAVVARADAETRRAYSETLLASVHRQKGLSRAVLSTHFYGGKEVMKERFRNILGKRGRKWGGLALALVLLGTAAAACTFGVKATQDGALSEEELAAWQEKVNAPEFLEQYLWCMYTDVSQIPSEECIEADNDLQRLLQYEMPADVKVLSGTKSGNTVTLELEGDFTSGLPAGTLTLVNEEPVSFTTPLYTAVETAARGLIEDTAETYISQAKEYASKELAFTEKYITDLFCSETFEIDGKTYYVWELFYRMKPNDIENVFLVGGMADENGWLTEQQSVGRPFLIASVDKDGKAVVEEQTWSSATFETGYTWEEYVYCHTYLGMENMYGILNGWPELNAEFLESIRNGREKWAHDWQNVALSYLSSVYGVYPEEEITAIPRAFYADHEKNGHGSAMVVQAVCGDRTVLLLMAGEMALYDEGTLIVSPVWQVCGEKWEPDRPQTVKEQNALPAGELSEAEMAAFTDYFNSREHNGLLRYPYTSLGTAQKYLDLMFYDLGEPVTDEAERNALAEAFYDGELPDTDCTKLTTGFIREYLKQNFFSLGGVDGVNADIWLTFETLKNSEPLPYLEDYDAYYMVHGDTMMSNYTFDRGVRSEDGTLVNLYYTTDLWQYNDEGELDILWDQPMCVSLWQIGDTWYVVSNQIVES